MVEQAKKAAIVVPDSDLAENLYYSDNSEEDNECGTSLVYYSHHLATAEKLYCDDESLMDPLEEEVEAHPDLFEIIKEPEGVSIILKPYQPPSEEEFLAFRNKLFPDLTPAIKKEEKEGLLDPFQQIKQDALKFKVIYCKSNSYILARNF